MTQIASLAPLPRSTDFDVEPASFSAASWLNQILSSSSPPPLSSLLDVLSDALRESHEALDSSLRDALKAVPWVVRESERVRQRANALRVEVDAVGERVAGVETGVASSVKTIADADTVVRRVQRAALLLETAANADVLLERLESLLASAGADGSDLVAAADVAAQLRKALLPLRDVKEVADRFAQLDRADSRLETLAAPQLRKALDARNRQAAVNARIVFDHAGRDNAFRTQYVSLRGAQVRQLWTEAWTSTARTTMDAAGSANAEDEAAQQQKLQAAAGELAAEGANDALSDFYNRLTSLVVAEAEWLHEAFPDVKAVLLPALVCDSLATLTGPTPRATVFLPPSASDPVSAADAIADRLFSAALTAVTAAARIASALLPDADAGNASADALPDSSNDTMNEATNAHVAVVDAVTALLMPHRKFWEALLQATVRQARTRADEIRLVCVPTNTSNANGSVTVSRSVRVTLVDLARDVETSSKDACAALDAVIGVVATRTCGIGVTAMKQAATTVSTVVSERLLRLLRHPTTTITSSSHGEDEWTRLNGALRLLIATSALKRAWDARKEAAFAVAIGAAMPTLELAAAVRVTPVRRTRQFLVHVNSGASADAGIVWELARDERLADQVVSEFESLESGNDFQNVIDVVHRVVYDTMFTGVTSRLSSFSAQELWSSDGADSDLVMAGLSNSPLRYATEVADYLMTIPQQLEPFVPDDEDATHATPSSLSTFSKLGAGHEKGHSTTLGADVGDSEVDGANNRSFAGIWISVLAIGTMELYVEKICNLSRLSEPGARQLATDVDYLSNVMASLGVVPTVEMSLVSKLLECKRDAPSFMEVASSYESAEHRKLIRRVAAVRGINVTL